MIDQIWLYAARTSGLTAVAAAISVVGVAVMFVGPLHSRLPVSLRLRLPTLIRVFAGIGVAAMAVRVGAFAMQPTLQLVLGDVANPTADPSPDPAGLIAVVVMAFAVGITLSAVAVVIYARSSDEDGEGRLDSPAAVLEEMRKRLEALPTLPEFPGSEFDDEIAEPETDEFHVDDFKIDLPERPEPIFDAPVVSNPFSEPAPPLSSITPSGPPPLPTGAVDPVTGEPDEEAYKAWLKEWLTFAETYGEETAEDPVRSAF